MKTKDIKVLMYYDLPQIFSCEDADGRYIFVLLDEEKLTYIGIDVDIIDYLNFLSGGVDLRTLFLLTDAKLYTGKFNGKEFNGELYSGELTEDILPGDGLFIKP